MQSETAAAADTTRRIIMSGSRSHLEIERSHIDGMAARMTASIGDGGGVLLHLTDAELARLVSAGLRLLAGSDVRLDALIALPAVRD